MRVAAGLSFACVLVAAVLATPAAHGGPAARADMLDIGDSLALGTAPYLTARLQGRRIEHVHDVGLHAYDVATFVASRGPSLQRLLVVSAGTNDDPRIVSTFWRAVARVAAVAGPRRCVVWPNIVRPPAVGATYDGLNGALARLDARYRNLVVVDWVSMVRRHPAWLAADGVHVSVQGYRARAKAIATALRARCP